MKHWIFAAWVGLMATSGFGVYGCASAPRAAAATDDDTIKVRVQTALLNAPDVPARQIQVDVAAGVVTLTGTVANAAQERGAVAAARTISGVKEVRSSIRLQ